MNCSDKKIILDDGIKNSCAFMKKNDKCFRKLLWATGVVGGFCLLLGVFWLLNASTESDTEIKLSFKKVVQVVKTNGAKEIQEVELNDADYSPYDVVTPPETTKKEILEPTDPDLIAFLLSFVPIFHMQETLPNSHFFRAKRSIDPVDNYFLESGDALLEAIIREKRLTENKLSEVKSEFHRCKKEAKSPHQCDQLYDEIKILSNEIAEKFSKLNELMEKINKNNRNLNDKHHQKEPLETRDFQGTLGESPVVTEKSKKKISPKEFDEVATEHQKQSSSQQSMEDEKDEKIKKDKKKKKPAVEKDESDEVTKLPEENEATTKHIKESSKNKSTTVKDLSEIVSTTEPLPASSEKAIQSEEVSSPSSKASSVVTSTVKATTTSPSTVKSTPDTTDSTANAENEVTTDILSSTDLKAPPKIVEEMEKVNDDHRKSLHTHFGHISENFFTKKQDIDETKVARDSGFGDPNLQNTNNQLMSLCEQFLRQQKKLDDSQAMKNQMTHVTDFQQSPVLPLAQLTSFGGVQQIPVNLATDTMRATNKVMMTPGINTYNPVCFYTPNPQYRSPTIIQQPIIYQNVAPLPAPVQTGGVYQSLPVTNPQIIRLPTQVGQTNPYYCTFLPQTAVSFPVHVTTGRGSVRSQSDDGKADEKEEAETFNIPTRYDVVYATYANAEMLMQNSTLARKNDNCAPNEISCLNTDQCVRVESWCDSKVDCMDASDETACTCKSRLDPSRICDGYMDCPLGTDELGCFGCDRFQFSCYHNRNEFERDGKSTMSMCYTAVEKCDGFTNCLNGKDEVDCSMIVRNEADPMAYSVSSSVGFLYRNHKGKWYPVCSNPETWAHEVCQNELGVNDQPPMITWKSTSITGPFIHAPSRKNPFDPTFSDFCEPRSNTNSAVFVACPHPKCGITKLTERSTKPKVHFQRFFTNQFFMNPRYRRDDGMEGRIVGGTDSEPLQWPFVVVIYRNGFFHCGGTIYNEMWIITAAHCVTKFEKFYFEVRAGVLRRYSYSPTVQISKVSHVFAHEDFERSTMKNDIALMRLEKPLFFNRWVRPICLPNKGRSSWENDWVWGPAGGTMCTTIGWGALRERGPDPDNLQDVEVPINDRCKYSVDREGENVCAGEISGGHDACQGDSGGPLVCRSLANPSEWYLAGVVSHGQGCARANEQGVYTRVALYINWIMERISGPMPDIRPVQQCPGFICVWGASKCIPKKLFCDGIVDCLGGEDEVGCPPDRPLGIQLAGNSTSTNMTTSTPSSTVSTTSTTSEITTTTVASTTVTPITSPPPKILKKKEVRPKKNGKFLCERIHQYLDIQRKCDHVIDCEDGSDEENCTCKDYLMNVYEDLICNGEIDCADGTDEADCATCDPDEFTCMKSLQCIPKAHRCDGNVDCFPYREDERDCFTLAPNNSIEVDRNDRPVFTSTKGFITKRTPAGWNFMCNDSSNQADHRNISDSICFILGFESSKNFTIVNITMNDDSESNPPTNPLLKIEKIHKSIANCSGIFVECNPIQSSRKTMEQITEKFVFKKSIIPLYKEVTFKEDPEVKNYTSLMPCKMQEPEEINEDLSWPWRAEIFLDGKRMCSGMLVDSRWVLADHHCLGTDKRVLEDHYAVAVFGSKAFLNISTLQEKIVRISCLSFFFGMNIVLMKLEKSVEYNKQIHPIFIPENENLTISNCISIFDGDSGFPIIYNVQQVEIDGSPTFFKKVLRKSLPVCPNDQFTKGMIVCKNKSTGWFPKAFFESTRGPCSFETPLNVTMMDKYYYKFNKIIDSGHCPNRYKANDLYCHNHRCPTGKCLAEDEVCNGIVDCHDGSDEDPEMCLKITSSGKSVCLPSQMKCQNGKCVEKSKFCDGVLDCEDSSDEPKRCSCFEYLRTVDPSKICDGFSNCFERTDEDAKLCSQKCSNNPSSFKCGDSKYCVSGDFVCDGVTDCPGGEDEKNCTGIFFEHGNSSSYGNVMQRSFGLWYNKCYKKHDVPSQIELEKICKLIGYQNSTEVRGRVVDLMASDNMIDTRTGTAYEISAITGKLSDHPITVESSRFNATKLFIQNRYSSVPINNRLRIMLRPSRPSTKLLNWNKTDKENCFKLQLKCN